MPKPACPNCGGHELYISTKPVSAGGGYAPDYLPGLGKLFRTAKFDVVVCESCGLTRMFASTAARAALQESPRWQRL
jgi:predicted nucleic-acid-binding Zn-ribbon protein